ncbi:MAG: retron St85 family RNA-directed DNA polymerase [Methanosarcina vacuolata]|nr:retron St85 family RNA-directed DNA polymerase [Methanosarcina vacuolata]
MKNKLTKNVMMKNLFEDYIKQGIIPAIDENEYEEQLKSFKILLSKKLPFISNIDHFCTLSNSSPKQIDLFLSKKDKGYTTFKLPKKNGGFREINAPSKKIKSVQRWILDNILYKLHLSDCAHGFVPGRSIITNASIHVNQDLVLGIDLKDFFPSINFKSVYHIFKSAGYTEKIAFSLADLCTYHWKLPQGAPTSPMLANLVTSRLDCRIANYCEKRNFRYSRYADDITISGSRELPKHKQIIIEIIERYGFTINEEKTRMFSRGSQQKVTGLVVNDKVSIGRKKKKTLRATVHNIVRNGFEIENRDNDPFFKEKIFGELAYARMIDPVFANPLIEILQGLDWASYKEEMTDLRKSELTVRSLEKKNYFDPVDRIQIIESESDFLDAIFNTISQFKHYVEDTSWIDAFWDGDVEVEIEGEKHKIPATPKNETKIQPTIYVFFRHDLNPLGIHVLRETDEGIGKLDFKFLTTIKGNIPLNVCAEFKLAHNERLEHGLTTQLPLYLKASPSKSGIFLVMWFKDEMGKYFNRPANKNKSEMLQFIEKLVKEINEKEEFKIESVLIDASKKPSASHR